MRITIEKARKLIAALGVLDGQKKVVHSAGRDEIVVVPYKLKPMVRLAIAQNITALKPLDAAFAEASRQVMLGYSVDGQTVPVDRQEAMGRDIEALLKSVEDVELKTLSEDDFNLAENDIPVTALAELLTLLHQPEASGE